MSDSSLPDNSRDHPRHAFVISTARGLKGFLWRVAWFALFLKILLFS